MQQVTASKAYLLLECARALHAEPQPEAEYSGDPAATEYGIKLHAAFEAYFDQNIVPEDDADIAYALSCLIRLLDERGWSEVNCECPAALNVFTGNVRLTDLNVVTHQYALESDEIGGTLDLLVADAAGNTIVIDFKTGQEPGWNLQREVQLDILAMMWNAENVAIYHCPRGGPHTLYERTPVNRSAQLVEAWRRRGDGSMRPGPHCRYCPARLDCPTRNEHTLVAAAALVPLANTQLSLNADPGAVHMLLGEFERLSRATRAELRARVLDGEEIVRPDGKVLRLQHSQYESISIKRLYDTLGKERADEIMAELRSVGAIQINERDSLVAR